MNRINGLDYVSLVIITIGALNWGLVGLFGFNLVDTLFGAGSIVAKIVYIIVGLAGLYTLYLTFKISSGAQEEKTNRHHTST